MRVTAAFHDTLPSQPALTPAPPSSNARQDANFANAPLSVLEQLPGNRYHQIFHDSDQLLWVNAPEAPQPSKAKGSAPVVGAGYGLGLDFTGAALEQVRPPPACFLALRLFQAILKCAWLVAGMWHGRHVHLCMPACPSQLALQDSVICRGSQMPSDAVLSTC